MRRESSNAPNISRIVHRMRTNLALVFFLLEFCHSVSESQLLPMASPIRTSIASGRLGHFSRIRIARRLSSLQVKTGVARNRLSRSGGSVLFLRPWVGMSPLGISIRYQRDYYTSANHEGYRSTVRVVHSCPQARGSLIMLSSKNTVA
jgi:hypothetical protein